MAKIEDMSLEERETHMNLAADVRSRGGHWKMYTDDLVMIDRMERLGMELEREVKGGGRYYIIPQNQITFRRKREEVEEEERARRSARARQNFGHGDKNGDKSGRNDTAEEDKGTAEESIESGK